MFLEKNRDRIEKDFEDFSRELPGKAEEIEKRMETLNADIVIGMKYLYSNMPYSDVGNYTFDTFLNYVLFHRTNDEEIKPCRTYFWEKIKDRIQGMSMMEAVLEINHWCAGEVMYQGTDMRTGSALEIYRSGVGRCGEEAVFVVNVLRSAGIPARPVYGPTVTTTTPGWRSGATATGITWEPVSRKQFWIRAGLPTLHPEQ